MAAIFKMAVAENWGQKLNFVGSSWKLVIWVNRVFWTRIWKRKFSPTSGFSGNDHQNRQNFNFVQFQWKLISRHILTWRTTCRTGGDFFVTCLQSQSALVILILLLLLLLNSDLSAPLLVKPFEITEIDQVRKIDHQERKCNRV